MSCLEISGVWKLYGQQVVLEGLNLSVKAGEFCTLVGASGCGKTTFLKILLGQERASRGQVLLDGEPLRDEPGVERGVVFQRYSVFPHLTVAGNVMLGLDLEGDPLFGRLWGRRRHAARARVAALLEQVGLGAAAQRYPHELSGGMQQRLAIAQSLIKRPRILLLDEPFGALDPGIRADMHTLIADLWRETGTTIFMVTHDIEEGFKLGSRLLVFDKVRDDPHEPQRYGARITYDIGLKHERPNRAALGALADAQAAGNVLATSAGTYMPATQGART